MVVNLAIIAIALYGHEQISSVLREGMKGELAPLIRVLGLPAVGSLVVGLLSWLIPRDWKEILVFFWRLGARRLPSSQAFTSIAPADLRIDMKQLSQRLGPASDSKRRTEYAVVFGLQEALQRSRGE